MDLSEIVAMQDVDEPIWTDTLPDRPTDIPHDDRKQATPGLMTSSGLEDFLQLVKEDLRDWLDDEVGTKLKQRGPRPTIIATHTYAAKSWRANTYNVDRALRLVTKRSDRSRVVVTNWGPGVLYLAAATDSNATQPSPNMIQVAPPGIGVPGITTASNSREFRTQDEIWAFPATIGTSQVVDVQDEYGEPEH